MLDVLAVMPLTPASYVEKLWEFLNVEKSPLGIIDAEKVEKMGAMAKHVEDSGARSCDNVENKDPATIDVNVFYGKGNEKGRKRLKEDGIKALASKHWLPLLQNKEDTCPNEVTNP